MKSLLLSPQEVAEEQLRAMCRVFQQADRVLVGNWRLQVKTHNAGKNGPPGWSDGSIVTFNSDKVDDLTSIDNIVSLTGLNYHEISHILFTPRKRESHMIRACEAEGMFRTFNLLEDQRIETLFTGMYSATEPYFRMTFMKYCLENEDQWDSNYMLAFGRKYLPDAIVAELRRKFKYPQHLQEIEQLIEEYRYLTFPSHESRALQIIRRFHELLKEMAPPKDPYGHGMAGRPETVTQGSAQGDDVQEVASEQAEDRDGDRDENGTVPGEDGNGEDGEGEGDGDEEGDEEGDGKGKGDGDADGDGNADGEDGDKDGKQGGKPGQDSGAGASKPMTPDEFKGFLKRDFTETLQSASVQADARNTQRIIVSDLDGHKLIPTPEMNKAQLLPVEPELGRIVKKTSEILDQRRIDLDPGWDRHQASGRINIQRAMRPEVDFDDVYDSWRDGVNDATDWEVVICLDLSSSMNDKRGGNYASSGYDPKAPSLAALASEALWMMKRSVEMIGGRVTALAFNDQSWMLYQADEKADREKMRVFNGAGGTSPLEAINESLKVFHHSKRKHKAFLVFSDGGWGDFTMAECHERIDRMNNAGIATVSGFFFSENSVAWIKRNQTPQWGKTWEEVCAHHCRLFWRLDDPTDMVPMARNMISKLMRG